jgi:hypothetical protein
MKVTVYTCVDCCEDEVMSEMQSMTSELGTGEYHPVYVPHDCYLWVPVDCIMSIGPDINPGYEPVPDLQDLLDRWCEYLDEHDDPFVPMDGGPNTVHRFVSGVDELTVVQHVFV